MEKVKIRSCEPIINGKAHSVEFQDGRKATAWNDKIIEEISKQQGKKLEEIAKTIIKREEKPLNKNIEDSGTVVLIEN